MRNFPTGTKLLRWDWVAVISFKDIIMWSGHTINPSRRSAYYTKNVQREDTLCVYMRQHSIKCEKNCRLFSHRLYIEMFSIISKQNVFCINHSNNQRLIIRFCWRDFFLLYHILLIFSSYIICYFCRFLKFPIFLEFTV